MKYRATFPGLAAQPRAAHNPPMRRAVVLQHAPMEGPGRIAMALERSGLRPEVHALHAGAPVPERIAAGDALVVMGGPMGVGDRDDPRYPFLAAEIELLRRAIADDRPVLGICLGAQLLAHAAGADVHPNRIDGRHVLEVGWAPVDFIGVGVDALLAGISARETVLHWHGDTFELPAGAQRFASSERCRNQAFTLGRQVGLQFHCEVDAGIVELWVREDGDYIRQANGSDGGERIRADTARHLPRQGAVCDRLIANIVSVITG